MGMSAVAWPADNGYRFAPDPPMVAVEENVPAEDVATSSSGLKYLVAADQVILTGPRPVWHSQVTYVIAEERGLENAGQISLSYQPAYQQIELHALDVWRAGQRIDRRSTSRIDVLRREAELESGILDGSLTVNITLSDLRVGDRVSYRYSVVGFNPVFGNGYYDNYTARFSVPLGLRLVSFIYPQSMQLRWKAPSDGFDAHTREQGSTRILEVRAKNLKGVSEEDGTPSTYSPYGRVEVSTAGGWADVATWATPLYSRRFGNRSTAELLIRQLKLDPDDPLGSALRATAFVQGEVRYTGLDMGQNSHAPNTPEITLERRFGDCKDKTALLIALLEEVGIRADPVLVHTELREAIRTRLPSPLAFNHVIVRATVAGQEIWIDPTLERERGDFATRGPLPYRYGLPVHAGATTLVEVPQPEPIAPLVDVAQTIALSVEKGNASAEFDVVTDYRQSFADNVRSGFSADGAEEIGKGYLNYMQGYYEGLRAKSMPLIEDQQTSVKVKEKYRLRWDKAEEGTGFGIVLFQVLDWLPKIPDSDRLAPLALAGPRHGRQTVRSTLQGGWSIDREQRVVETPYFRFQRTVSVEGNALVIVADWRRSADEVPAKDVRKLRRDIAEVRDLLQYNVDLDPESSLFATDFRDWWWALAALILAAVLLSAAWLLRRRVAVAGMLYRPHATISEILARGKLGSAGLALILLSIAVNAVIEIGSRIADDSTGRMIAAAMIGIPISLGLRWLIWSGLVKLAFRILGQRLDYVALLKVGGWAASPMIFLFVVALLALKFDFSGLADGTTPTAAQWPGLMVAFALALAGTVWTSVATVNAYAGVASVSRWRALAATTVAMAIAVAVALPFVLVMVTTRYSG
jgi:hypothetical protein